MFTVVKLGGCNGSGKTSVARALLKTLNDGHGADPGTWRGAKKSPNVYTGFYKGHEVYVLGSYETACGGMDTISDKLERLAMVQWACKVIARGGIVFFEGLITGKTYGALGQLSEQHIARKTGRWLYTFMDTPFDVCVDRVLVRRAMAGNDAPFDPERTMRPTYDSCQSLLRKLRGEQQAKIGPQPHPHPTLLLNHKHKPAKLALTVLDAAVALVENRYEG